MRHVEQAGCLARRQVFFEWAPWERFLELFGGSLPIPVMIAVWPVRSLKMALRLHHEVPGIEVPEDMIREMEQTLKQGSIPSATAALVMKRPRRNPRSAREKSLRS